MKYTLTLSTMMFAVCTTWGCASTQSNAESADVETAVDENEAAVAESEETAEEWREESAEEATDGVPDAEAVSEDDPGDLESEDLNSTVEGDEDSE